MGKTDKTRPFWVKMAEDPKNYKEVHRHSWRLLRDAQGDVVREKIEGKFYPNGTQATRNIVIPFTKCDLPAAPGRSLNWDECHYDHTAEWIAKGEAHCGCPMCTDQDGRREARRRERHAGKTEARNWEDEY